MPTLTRGHDVHGAVIIIGTELMDAYGTVLTQLLDDIQIAGDNDTGVIIEGKNRSRRRTSKCACQSVS